MSQVKELLIEEMQDLLHAENQLLAALPNMAKAAKAPKLREAFEKHLEQTRMHVERLKETFQLLGSEAEPTPCRAMAGLIEEGKERIEETGDKEDIAADLSLIIAAQKVEHYEIAGYGNLQNLALSIEERDAARLFARTLGEEEATDHLLTEITKPLLQQIRAEELKEAVSSRKTRHA
jgi:Mn-containing catalase